jgi:hypothetical protein
MSGGNQADTAFFQSYFSLFPNGHGISLLIVGPREFYIHLRPEEVLCFPT